ncbi:hypothetical protein [Parvibaculum sp.]|uniref:hypothetical protein n=1 Tax=Parvibaculum sp. TaxID=2024848 RepID=UPI001B2170F8|nr:hypothetical protein [Parvibaculum sp.]MBO6669608.1 hypothetical protein [Parvibaculum sp.]MBO6715994.1 hypothetical protein [Parvibaculum sp.]
MRIAFVLAALLIWDMATTADGHSALERAGRLLMSFEPVRDLVDYAEDDLVEDVKSLTAAVSGDAAAVMAARSLAEQEREARREQREKRRAELRLTQDEVEKIAKAVTELYRKEEKDAEEAQPQAKLAPPKSAPAPEPETVEKSVASLGPDLLSSIVEASKKTGANSGYLLHIALRESGLVLGAQAPTSSATGPFQFIQGTWYQMLGTYGAKHGLSAEAALLKKRGSRYEPVSSDARIEVLALRTDPYVAALMAGELTMENMSTLARLLGRSPAHGELYAAHVFGPAGAVKLVKTRETASATSAASILPSAAAANRWLFYDRAGKARTVAALFDELSRFMSTSEVATVCKADLNFLGV